MIVDARHHDPFSVLGRQADIIRLFLPDAEDVELLTANGTDAGGTGAGPFFTRIENSDFFELQSNDLPHDYQLGITDKSGNRHIAEDTYRFGPQIGELDLHLFNEGRHQKLYKILGAHQCLTEGVAGIRFCQSI